MKRVKITYTSDCFSSFKIPSCSKWVNLKDCTGDEIEFMWSYNARHNLRLLLPDEERDTCVYEKYSCTLDSFLDTLEPPVEKLSDCEVFYIRDVYRKMFRSMVRFLWHLHSKGFCASTTIGRDNLVMLNGELKFFGLRYQKLTVALREKNLKDVSEIITGIIGPSEIQKFPYFVRFLLRLQTAQSDEDVKALIDHLAVISLAEICKFVEQVREKGEALQGFSLNTIVSAVVHEPKSLEDVGNGRSAFARFVRARPYKKSHPCFRKKSIFRCCRDAVNHLRLKHYARNLEPEYIGAAIMGNFGVFLEECQQRMVEMNSIDQNDKNRTFKFITLLDYTIDSEKVKPVRKRR